MRSKDPKDTRQKPVPQPPQPLSDLPPKVVSDDDGERIKGGPSSHPWQKPLS